MSKVLVVYSGGLDSTALLYKCISEFDEIEAINFNYGSKHNSSERKAAEKICEMAGIKLTKVELPFINELFKSDLLQSGGDIPEGHYEAENMKSTVVPFRNGIMLSIAAGYGESIGASMIAIANHGGDHHIYKDCRLSFIDSMRDATVKGTDNEIGIYSPFVNINKAEVVTEGLKYGAPLELTWSCYKGGEVQCGRCSTDMERKAAFREAGWEDPTEYLDPTIPDYEV